MEGRRLHRLILALALVGAAAPAFATDAGTGAPPQESAPAELTAILDEQVKAWNAGDLEKFCAFYAEDAVFTSPSGTVVGRAEVLARYRKKYKTAADRGTLTLEPQHFTRVGADGWALVGRWKLKLEKKKPASGTTALVFRRRADGQWEIAQDASF